MSTENLRAFIADDSGQDLVEYTLLLAFMAMASGALFLGGGTHINTIWTLTNNNLSAAASVIGN